MIPHIWNLINKAKESCSHHTVCLVFYWQLQSQKTWSHTGDEGSPDIACWEAACSSVCARASQSPIYGGSLFYVFIIQSKKYFKQKNMIKNQ